MESQRKATVREITNQLEWVKTYLEIIGKTVLGALAICYVTGLLVESIFFSNYGVAAFSLLRLNYILAGVWVLLLYAAITVYICVMWALLPISSIAKHVRLYDDMSRKRAFWISAGVIIAFTVVVLGVAFQFARSTHLARSDDWFLLLFFGPITAIPFLNLHRFFYLPNLEPGLRRKFTTSLVTVAAFATPFFYCVDAGPAIYRLVPAEVGGGKLRYVSIIIRGSQSTFNHLEKRGVQFDDNVTSSDPNEEYDRLTVNSQLIVTTETDYYIFLSNDTTVSISRDLVKAISYW